jgi:hypothetical protein
MRRIALLLAVTTLAACGHPGYARYSSLASLSRRGMSSAMKRRRRTWTFRSTGSACGYGVISAAGFRGRLLTRCSSSPRFP